MTRRVFFVLPRESEESIQKWKSADASSCHALFAQGLYCWILQTYILLRDAGFECELSNAPAAGCINVVFNPYLNRALAADAGDGVLIGVRADYPAKAAAHIEVVQNKAQLGPNRIWMPHWPQPGLIRRDDNRRNVVRSVGYFGRPVNHYRRYFRKASGFFRVQEVITRICADLDLELHVKPQGQWHDYHDVDIVIAHRTFGSARFDTKPASKLTNAWLAGAVFVGGADSAFVQAGSPGYDFFRATTEESLRNALILLKEHPAVFANVVERGTAQAVHYTQAQVARRWTALLEEADLGFWRAKHGARAQ